MNFTDSHCHIHSVDYPLLIPQVDAHCQAAGVTNLLCVGTDLTDSQRAVAFVQNRKNNWASIGLHPHDAKLGQGELDGLRTLLGQAGSAKIVAIGECGLDYFYTHSSKTDQQKALRFQIELALEHKLPLIFHVRDAFDDFWPIFDSYPGLRGVVHSFTDNMEQLKNALSRGLHIGVNGIITFTKNDWQLEVAKAIPLDRMLLETDAPFLTPKPLRGKVNEPAHIRLVAEFLGSLRGEAVETVASQSTTNARQLFSF